MEYAEHVSQVATTHPDLAARLSHLHTIKDVLDWMQENRLSLNTLDIVTQDEFTHDAIVPVSESLFVSFGIT